MPAISVIIPTHNRPLLVERVITKLMQQTLPQTEFELIVVDSASTDHTPATLANLARAYSNLKTFRTEKKGASAARNVGLENATAPLLVLLDDDILVEKDFLEKVASGAQKNPGCILLGNILAPWEQSRVPFHRFLLQSKDVNAYDFADKSNVPPNYFYTACVAIPREALGATRFDENFTVYGIEDLDFGIRLLKGGVRMVYLPELAVRHDYYPRYSDYRRKKLRTGYSLAYFMQKQPENAAYFYIEPDATRRKFRIYRVLAAPLAALAYLFEKILRRRSPLPAILYNWFYWDLRVQLYTGMRRFRQGMQP